MPAEGNGEATTGSATEQSPDAPVPSKGDAKGLPATGVLPATGDAVVPIAIGIIAVAGICAFVIMHRRP